jgi:uncharacterized membrane protein YqhA
MAYKAGDLFVDIKGSTSGATRSISAVIKKLTLLQSSLKSIDTSNLSRISSELGMGGGGSSRGRSSRASSSRASFGILNIARWTTAIYMGRRLGRVVANIAQEGANYSETLNLWETAMGSNLDVATEFVNKMNEAYGISEKTLMNAQAIFKNMLGSLGQISDTMAYQLSEGITQMALDYASLYNVTFEQAFTKFQAALAGQVRPIRSVAGYDITETTLFQLYQSLGGTKTMRQLTRTEKQLLSIYAIFQQMDKSGAIGDLDKTMESFANQSRVMAEAWQQIKSYAGILLTYSIRQSGIMIKINGILIFIGDTLKALAESMGAIEHFGGDVFESTTESALGASDAIDEVKGKLLDFDKFRALSSVEEENALGLDEKLLNALSNFDTILGDASMKAREFADYLKVASGLFDKDGVFNPDRWKEIATQIKIILKLILAVLALSLANKLVIFGKSVYSNVIQPLTSLAKNLPTLVGKMSTTIKTFGVMKSAMLGIGVAVLSIGLTQFISNLDKMGDTAKTLIPTLSILAGVITALVAGLTIMKGNWVGALSLGAIITGVGLSVGTTLATQNYKDGGVVDRGTIFRAGEAGTEVVSNTNGVTEVTNVKQMEQAFYNALVRYGSSNNGKIEVTLNLDGEKVYKNTTEHAKQHGYAWSKA